MSDVSPSSDPPFDAILVVSFGGPEKPDDVIPFLENVLRGKPVPKERMLEVAEHYYHFGGVSPINQQCRDLIDALRDELQRSEISLPVYWGNRNWDPYLKDVVRQMSDDGIRRAIAYVTSGFSCYSGCRQYRENITDALQQIQPSDLRVEKLRVFYNHPDFIEVWSQNLQQSIRDIESQTGTGDWCLAFTAHSIPLSMATTSDYEQQLQESCRLLTERLQIPDDRWQLVYQSRSGRPQDPWLEPDILDHIRLRHSEGVRGLIIAPIGFLSDHMEVLYDLDDEARLLCESLQMPLTRAATPGNSPQFVQMLRKLIQERISNAPRECTGRFGPNHDTCPPDCCPAPMRPAGAGKP
ncbi:MAG: ferrochelatase [Planctomycetaceae bacterium]|nr:ferrochelatase [Planctomycetaceae bacterium]